MCVHPTKSGAQCKREPKQTLCSTHLINITLVPSERFPGMMEAPAINKLFIMNGDDVVAEFIPNPTPEDEAEYQRQHAEHQHEDRVMPQLRAKREVKCGNCNKNNVAHPYHATAREVKNCYARRYRVSNS